MRGTILAVAMATFAAIGTNASATDIAAEPQLFSSVRFADAPPSWTEMATNPDPRHDSFAVAVWGALREYDWTELTKGAGQ